MINYGKIEEHGKTLESCNTDSFHKKLKCVFSYRDHHRSMTHSLLPAYRGNIYFENKTMNHKYIQRVHVRCEFLLIKFLVRGLFLHNCLLILVIFTVYLIRV